MAEVIERDVAVGPEGEIVERRQVHRRRFSPLAALILLAFVGTCAVVFFGDRLGLQHAAACHRSGHDADATTAADDSALSRRRYSTFRSSRRRSW